MAFLKFKDGSLVVLELIRRYSFKESDSTFVTLILTQCAIYLHNFNSNLT